MRTYVKKVCPECGGDFGANVLRHHLLLLQEWGARDRQHQDQHQDGDDRALTGDDREQVC